MTERMRSTDPMVGSSVASNGAISDGSDNAALLDFCFLCSKQFFHDDLDNYGTQRLKDEDILEIFFEELGPVDRALLQCCPSCQHLCKTLTRTKEALSSLINEITSLLLRSRKVSYLLSKSRVVSRLFQSSNISLPPSEVSSSYLHQPLSQINFSKDVSNNNSNNCFPTQFNLRLDTSNLCVDDPLNLTSSHSNISNIVRKSDVISSKKNSSNTGLDSATCSSFSLIYNDSIMNSVSDNACDISEQVNIAKQSSKVFSIHQEQKTSLEDVSHKSKEKGTKAPEIYNNPKSSHLEEKVKTDNNFIVAPPPQTQPASLSVTKNTQTGENFDESEGKLIMCSKTKSEKKSTKYKCHICNSSFKTARNLKNHESAHKQEWKFICELCGVSYRHKIGLENHVALIHRDQPKFQCETCLKTFSQKIGLQRHVHIHTKKFQFVCDTCGKQFLHHTSFKAHKLIHTGAKSFSCPICDLAFALKSNLQRHLKIHTGEKPHSCSLCDRSFSERYNLLAHIKSHDSKPGTRHHCTKCSKTFTRKFKLQQHMKHIHGY